MDTSNHNSEFWNDRYLNDNTGWDMGMVSPPLRDYFDQLTDKDISILIPGCGNSYEAAWLLENGFTNITLIDIAATLVDRLRTKFQSYTSPPLTLISGDFFDLQGQFDLIVEQTFFCALDPSLRKDYVAKMFDLLKPGGKLSGLLFDREFEGGPPFGGSKEEYQTLFAEKFTIRTMEACYNSIEPRAGTEVFFIVEKD